MKILFFSDSLGSGGAQRQMVSLAVSLKKIGNDVSFLVYHNLNFFKPVLDDANIDVKYISEDNKVKRFLKLRKYIRKGNYDIVQSFLEPVNFVNELSVLPFGKWKVIVGERSSDPKIFTNKKRYLLRWFHFFADYIVSNSYENMRMVQKINPFLSKKKCKVIYNYIDSNKWKPSNEYLPLKDNKLNLVVAASHQYLKNAKGLIEAVSLLNNDEKAKLRIKWYGDRGNDDSFDKALELINKYSLNEVVKFKKAVPNINNIFQHADIVGLFSFYEGLPNTVCEAMTVGKPVIASSVSDIPFLLNNNQSLLFKPDDVNDIKRVLSYVLTLKENELIRIGEKNRERGISLFEKKNTIDQYLKLYSK